MEHKSHCTCKHCVNFDECVKCVEWNGDYYWLSRCILLDKDTDKCPEYETEKSADNDN